MVKAGLITRLEADKKIIEVHESVIKQYDNQILAGNKLTQSETKDYKDRLSQIANIEKRSIESVKKRVEERRKKADEEKAIERELTANIQAEADKRTEYLILMYEAERKDAKVAFEERKAQLDEEAEKWKSAADFIAGQVSGLSEGLGKIATSFGKAMESAIKDGKISAESLSNIALGVMETVFQFQQMGINKNLNLTLSAIDKETKAKLYAAGIETRTAEQSYNDYVYKGDALERQKALDFARQEERDAQKRMEDLESSESATADERRMEREEYLAKEKAYNDLRDAGDKYRDQERLQQLEQARDIERIMANAEDRKARAKYEADYQNHFNAVAMTIANGAAAIVAGYAQLGPIAGSVAAGVTAGVTAAQVAIMNENKPIRPYAVGTDFAAGGMALVGERGPELVNMPRGSQVFTNGETKDIMRRGTGLSVVVNNFSPEAIDAATSDRMTRRSMRQLAFQGAF
jgi:hypothetical protein